MTHTYGYVVDARIKKIKKIIVAFGLNVGIKKERKSQSQLNI
jgi:hypothetical protein